MYKVPDFRWVMYNTKIKTAAISRVETAMIEMVKIINSELLYYNNVTPKINLLSNIINNLTGVGKDIETVGNTLMNIDAVKGAAAAFVSTSKNIAMSVIRVSQLGQGIYHNIRFLYDSMLQLEIKKNQGIAKPKNILRSSDSVDMINAITSDADYMSMARRIMMCNKEIDNMMDAMTIYSKEAIVNISTIVEIMKMTYDEFKADKNNRIEDSLKKTIFDEFSIFGPKLRGVVSTLINHDKHLKKAYNSNYRDAWKSYIDENSFDPAFNVRDVIEEATPENILITATKLRNALGVQIETAQRELDNLEKADEATFNIKLAEISDPERARFRAYNLAIKDLQSGREKSIRMAVDGLTKCISMDEKKIGECVTKLPRIINDTSKNKSFYIGAVKHVDALRDNATLQKRVVEMLKAASKNPALDLKTAKNIDGFVEKQFAIEKMNGLSEDLKVSSKIMREEAIDDLNAFNKKLDAEINLLSSHRNINKSFTDGVINSNDLEDVSLVASGIYGSPFSVPFKYHGGCLTCGGNKMVGGKGKISKNLFVKDDKRRFYMNTDGTAEVLLYMTPEENEAFVDKKIMSKKFPKIAEIRTKLEDGLIDKKMAAKMFEKIRFEVNDEKLKEINKFYNPEPAKVIDNLFNQNKEIVYLLVLKSISKSATYVKLTAASIRNIFAKSEIVLFQLLGSDAAAKTTMEQTYVAFDAIIKAMDDVDFTDYIPGEYTVSQGANTPVLTRAELLENFSKTINSGVAEMGNIVISNFGAIGKNIEKLADFFIKAHFRKMGKEYNGETEKVFHAFKGLPIYKFIKALNIEKLNVSVSDMELISNHYTRLIQGDGTISSLSTNEQGKVVYSHLKYRTEKVVKFINNCIFVMKSIFKLMCNMSFVQICVAIKYFMLLTRGDEYANKTLAAPARKVYKILLMYTSLIANMRGTYNMQQRRKEAAEAVQKNP